MSTQLLTLKAFIPYGEFWAGDFLLGNIRATTR